MHATGPANRSIGMRDARGEVAIVEAIDVHVAVACRCGLVVPGLPGHAGVVVPQMLERFVVARPGRAVPSFGGVGGALRSEGERRGDEGGDPEDEVGIGRGQQQGQFATAGLPAHDRAPAER